MSKVEITSPRFLTTLATLFVTFSIVSVAVGYKMINLADGFIFSGAAFVIPFRYLIGDIIAEIYGYEIAKKQIFNLVLCCMVFSISVYIISRLPGPPHWTHQTDYMYVLGSALHITLIALIGMFLGIYINMFLIIKLKFILKFNPFFLRAFLASGLGEFIQYCFVITLLYYPILPFRKVISIIFSDYALQILIIGVMIIPAQIIMKLMKSAEPYKIKNFDFNPFQKIN